VKQPVNSALSKRILLQLNREPAESVSALAETLQAPRPSVSRAIDLMNNDLIAMLEGAVMLATDTTRKIIRV